MANDFPGYIADLLIRQREMQNEGSHESAELLGKQMSFAVQDAKRVGALSDPEKFGTAVAHQMVNRGWAKLYGILAQPAKSLRNGTS